MPLLVGGSGEAAWDRTARFGDGWHGIGLKPDQVPAHFDGLRKAFEAQGRSFDGLPFQLRLHIPVEDVDVEAWKSRFDRYAAAGVTELVLAPQSGDLELQRRWLDTLVPALTA